MWSLFKKKKKRVPHNLKGRVQCSESCQIWLHNGEELQARLCELNWLGMVIDNIPGKHEEALKEPVKLLSTLPRSFGKLELEGVSVKVTHYATPAHEDKYLRLSVVLQEGSDLDCVRDFVKYRNRRFARHQMSRKSLQAFSENAIIRWLFLFPSAVFVLWIAVYKVFFAS